MPVLFNFDDVDAAPMAPGAARRPLITPQRVGNDCIVLDHWTMDAGVPDAKRFDAEFEPSRLRDRCVDWRVEPMLDSEHDARNRIYLVTPTLFGTKSVKGEMIVYPPGTEASNHHHEGAEHFQYIISGQGYRAAQRGTPFDPGGRYPVQLRIRTAQLHCGTPSAATVSGRCVK